MVKAKEKMTCAKAAELSAKLGIADITGSERNVAKATKVRLDAILRTLKAVARRKSTKYKGAGIEVLRAAISEMSTDAQWWIDNQKDALHLVAKEIERANMDRLANASRD